MKQNRRSRDAQAKAKRQKLTVAIGGGILVLVLAIQVPRVMNVISPGGERAAAASAAPAAGTVAASATSAVTAPGSGSADADAASGSTARAASSGEEAPLFDHFSTKDPFAPQLTTDTRAAGQAASPDGQDTRAVSGDSAATEPGASLVPMSQQATSAATAAAKTAVIAVNGASSQVTVGAVFPAQDPMFRLAGLSAAGAKVAIAGGSYASGAGTVTVPLHGSLTLLNTATGVRYRLQFLSVG
jgi:trimeric autotransporter adhesin